MPCRSLAWRAGVFIAIPYNRSTKSSLRDKDISSSRARTQHHKRQSLSILTVFLYRPLYIYSAPNSACGSSQL